MKPGSIVHRQHVYDGIMRGIEDFQRGNVTDAKEGLARIRSEKGW